MAAGSSSSALPNRQWFIAQRWQAYDAEGRANLLRIIAIGAFYCIHLWSYLSAQGRLPRIGFLQMAEAGAVDRQFHVLVTLLAVAWAMLALGILVALQQRLFPRWLPYFSTGCDLVLLTTVLCISTGPRSPLVAGYFLILVLATLRLSLPLIWFTTAGCAIGYLVVLGCARWFPLLKGLSEEVRVPRYHQAIVLLAIVLAGIMLGQVVRRVQGLVRSTQAVVS